MVQQQLNLFTWHNKWCQASSPTVSTKWVLSKTLRHLIDKLSSHYTLWSGFVFCLKLLHRQHRFIWYIDSAAASPGEDSEHSQSSIQSHFWQFWPDSESWLVIRDKQFISNSQTITFPQENKVTMQNTVIKRMLCIRSYQLGVNCKYIAYSNSLGSTKLPKLLSWLQ